jgi:tetratricopeptide (TPR) repeat protein/transcriptional regulator with XRE-family HTH domain
MTDGAAQTGSAKRRHLAERRKAVGLTQEQLAALLGVERTTVVRWERGQTDPLPWLRPMLAGALEVSADRLEELLAVGGAPPDPQGRAAAVPRQLPPAVANFTGRAAELAALTRMLDDSGGTAGPVVVSAIGGTAGVGKTALAVHWGHDVAGRFPDGQLYVNLRGYDPDQPMPATDALAGFLASLGMAGQDIPADEADRAAQYRSLLAGKQMLIVLDNAATVEQVRPLLPGHPECRVVVTSRDSLPGLIARDGARRLDLNLLPLADAIELLRQLIGARADAEPAAVTELAEQCARLPLALRVAAELAVARPAAPLRDLVAELSDRQRRLDELSVDGDPRTAVRAVFSWSYAQLDDDTARAFRLAGLQPGADFDVHALAALAGRALGQADRALGTLMRSHLLQAASPDRYCMHDLLRAYARELAVADDAADSCHQALTRLFDYYLATAAAAMNLVYPAEARQRPPTPASSAAMPTLASEAYARAWLDRERANLVAAVVHCAGHGWPDHASGLAATLFRYLMNGSHLAEARTVYGHVLQAAGRSGDAAAEAEALNGLGGIGIMSGHFRDAAGHYRAALERYRRCGDHAGQARVLQNLGVTEDYLHNYRSASEYHRQAIAAFEDAGNSLGAARALADLAGAETDLGCYDQAAEHLQRALPVLRDAEHGDEARALTALGLLSLRRDQLAQAADFYEQALRIYRRIGEPGAIATGLFNLGEVSLRQRGYQQAIGYLREALALHRKVGGQYGETLTLRSLAQALQGAGQPDAARAELTSALRLAAETGNTYQQASAHRDLAESHRAAGQDRQACYHWQQALTLFSQLGASEADDVREQLAVASAG